MAKYSDIVAGLTVGDYGNAGPEGFTNRWDGPFASQRCDVITAEAAPSGKAIRLWMTDSNRFFLSWDGLNSDADRGTSVQRLIIVPQNTALGSSATFGGPAARGNGTGSSETGAVGNYAYDGSSAVMRASTYTNAASSFTPSTATGMWQQGVPFGVELSVSGTTMTLTSYDINDLGGTPTSVTSRSCPASNANNWHGLFGFASSTDYLVYWWTIGTGTDTPDWPTTDEPVLTLPTGAATGESTASGSVTTNTASGTLYAVVTTSATPPTKPDIIAGTGAVYATNQSVTATGVQNVNATGLAADTTYYWHFLHNDSNVATSASFTTDAVPVTPPATAPVNLNAVAQSDTVIRLTWDVLAGATGYKIRRDSTTVTDVGNVLTFDVTGLTAETQYGFEVLAYNSAGDGLYSEPPVLETTQATPNNIVLIADVDGANVSSALSSIVNPSSQTPRFNLEMRPTAINGTNLSGWRHSSFAISNAEGKSPVFALNRNTMTLKTIAPAINWLPMYTLNPFVLEPAFVQATSRTLIGGSTGTIEWSFPDPLPAGTIYVMTHPMGVQGQAALLAQHLLNDYQTIATPTTSANVSGVYLTSPAEVDENGRQIGGHNCYAIKLTFAEPTIDGGPKRKLIQTAGQHVAGEASSWLAFYSGLKYLLDSPNADAVRLRSNFDVYLYFNVCPNGLFGGHGRHNYRSSVDMNRDWVNQALTETAAVASAILVDTGGSADVCFDWHCYRDGDDDDKFIMLTPDTPNARRFGELGEPIFGMPYKPDEWFNTAGSLNVWAYDNLGVAFTAACECPQRGDTSAANYNFIGEAWTKTLAAADADGMFYQAPATYLPLNISGIPDGTYTVNLCLRSTGVQIAQADIAFVDGHAQYEIDLAVGTAIAGYIVDPPNGAAIYGVLTNA